MEAKIIWIFEIAEEDWPFASCDHIDNLFAHRFPGCNVAETLGVGHTKASCSVRHGLGPVTHDELAKDIDESSNMIAFAMDESTTKHVIKDMDILVPYCSEKKFAVVKRYLDSQFYGHAKAVELCGMVYDVYLSMDGQNIDKSLWGKEVNERLISLGFPGFLPLLVC